MTKSRKWSEVRAEGRARRPVDEERAEELRSQMRAEVRAFRLAEVRKAQHVSQAALAEAMGVSQPRVSQIERGEVPATEVGTLTAYVEALGGKVRVVADFGDESLTIA
jgi:predicted XRE-type DNA-binding protein